MELTKTQKLFLALLAASPLKNTFYWTGGTLLSAFYLQHRLSLDLDFFSEKPFDIADVLTVHFSFSPRRARQR